MGNRVREKILKNMLDVEGTFELLRGVPIPCWLLASVVLLSTHVGPVGAVHEFTAHRMQHFDLHGNQYGTYVLCAISF